MTEVINVTPDQVDAARLEVAIDYAAGLDPDPLVALLADAQPGAVTGGLSPRGAGQNARQWVEPDSLGYRGPTACAAAGITARQLDYWARTGLVEPSLEGAGGAGAQRLYSFQDILALKVVKRLLDTGVPLQNIRVAVAHLRERGVEDLAQITLMSDGVTVYECTSPDEVVDLVQGGQGVFGIAVGRVVREVEGSLMQLSAERIPGLPLEREDEDIVKTAHGGAA